MHHEVVDIRIGVAELRSVDAVGEDLLVLHGLVGSLAAVGREDASLECGLEAEVVLQCIHHLVERVLLLVEDVLLEGRHRVDEGNGTAGLEVDGGVVAGNPCWRGSGPW